MMTVAQRAAQKAIDEKKNTVKLQSKFVSDNAGWMRIFSYYKPSSMIIVMVLLALTSGVNFPLFAVWQFKLQYAFYDKGKDPDWESDSKMYLGFFGITILLIFAISSAEKISFGIMGERLTARIKR